MTKVLKFIKRVDGQGRLTLPKKWRDQYLRNHSVRLMIKDGEIIVKPNKTEDISDLIDSVELDIKSDLSDWDAVKKELYD